MLCGKKVEASGLNGLSCGIRQALRCVTCRCHVFGTEDLENISDVLNKITIQTQYPNRTN